MGEVTVKSPMFESDVTLVKLAREIAMDIHPLETILKSHGIDDDRWENLKRNTRFLQLIETEAAAWNGALNTAERVKVKAGALLEEWLPELYARLHDPKELLSSKIEGGKLAARLAGMGLNDAHVGGSVGERFSVTINLGSDQTITIDKQLPPKVIEGQAVETP